MIREASESVLRQQAYELMKEHLRRVEETVRGVVRIVDALASKSGGRSLPDSAASVWEAGERADEAKAALMEFLARAGPSFLDKEDYLRLVLEVDSVADWMDGVSYRLRFIAESGMSFPVGMRRRLKELTGAVLDVFEGFKEAFFLLGVNAEEAMKACSRVEGAERRVDRIQRDFDFEILKSSLPIAPMLLLRDVVFGLEEAADLIEKASNDMRCIAVARFG